MNENTAPSFAEFAGSSERHWLSQGSLSRLFSDFRPFVRFFFFALIRFSFAVNFSKSVLRHPSRDSWISSMSLWCLACRTKLSSKSSGRIAHLSLFLKLRLRYIHLRSLFLFRGLIRHDWLTAFIMKPTHQRGSVNIQRLPKWVGRNRYFSFDYVAAANGAAGQRAPCICSRSVLTGEGLNVLEAMRTV